MFQVYPSPFLNAARGGPLARYAVQGIAPHIVADFRNGVYGLGGQQVGFSDLFVFARASLAHHQDAGGGMLSYPADTPRHVPGEGLLVESATTANLLPNSTDLTAETWFRPNLSAVPRSDSWFDCIGEGPYARIGTPDVPTTAQSRYCWSVEVDPEASSVSELSLVLPGHRHGDRGLRVQWNIGTGVTESNTFDQNSDPFSVPYAGVADGRGNKKLIWACIHVPSVSLVQAHLWLGKYDGADKTGQNAVLRNPQLEPGSFPTSRIPTAGSQATRAGETLRVRDDVLGQMPLAPSGFPESSFAHKLRIPYLEDGQRGPTRLIFAESTPGDFISARVDLSQGAAHLHVTQSSGGTPSEVSPGIPGAEPGTPLDLTFASQHSETEVKAAIAGSPPLSDFASSGVPGPFTAGADLSHENFAGYLEMVRVWSRDIGDLALVEVST